MLVRLVRKESRILAVYKKSLGTDVAVDLSIYRKLDPDANRILVPLCDYISRLRARSAVNYLRGVNEIGKALDRAGIRRLPKSEAAWQKFVLAIHHQVIMNPESKASLKTRACITLSVINTLLAHLQEDGLIPLSTILPDSTSKFDHIVQTPHSQQVLGQQPAQPVEEFNSQLLCDISLSRRDAEYLDEIRDRLAQRRSGLRNGLLEYWQAMKSHVEWGKKSLETVDIHALIKRLETVGLSDREDGKFGRNSRHFCTPDSAEGLPRLLALIKYSVGGVPTEKELRKAPYLPRMMLENRDRLFIPSDVTMFKVGNRLKQFLRTTRLRWFLGRLYINDIAVLSALIIMEHPNFTPEAITQARLFDRRGKKFIEFGDQGAVFTVEKHRAHKTKKATLSPLTQEIITFIAGLAPDVRERLRNEGSPLAEALFIAFDVRGRTPQPPKHENIVSFLSGRQLGAFTHAWFADYIPSIATAGFNKGSISFKRIRNTEGVLEWFKSGSTKAMSRTLGNKERTAVDRYLPKPLLLAWNTRLIRRFQNLWISVAAANEDYQLEVTDFSSVEDLQRFLIDMLEQHEAGSSPLAMELHARFSQLPGSDGDTGSRSALSSLAVNLSKNSLAALYLYQEAVMSAGCTDEQLNRTDPTTGVSLRNFLDLASLLRHQLPNDKDQNYRLVHEQADQLVTNLRQRIKWTDLIIKKVA